MSFSTIIQYLPLVVAPVVLALFSFISAYVFKFGLPRTGINQDYVLFVIFVVLACIFGGAV